MVDSNMTSSFTQQPSKGRRSSLAHTTKVLANLTATCNITLKASKFQHGQRSSLFHWQYCQQDLFEEADKYANLSIAACDSLV